MKNKGITSPCLYLGCPACIWGVVNIKIHNALFSSWFWIYGGEPQTKISEVGISPTAPTSSRESRQPFVHLVFQMLQCDIDASVDKSACEFRSRRRGPELLLQILSQYSSWSWSFMSCCQKWKLLRIDFWLHQEDRRCRWWIAVSLSSTEMSSSLQHSCSLC